MKKILSLILLLFVSVNFIFAQGIEGKWLNEEGTAKVQIYLAKDKKYYGKIVWLKEPNANGKPKVDSKNPNKSLQSRLLLNLVNLRGFNKISNTKFEDGTIYDPKNGKTYDCIMTLNGNNLDIRGYIGISLIGRTTKWTRTN